MNASPFENPPFESPALDLLVADGIAEIVLKGPGKGNALGPDFWKDMPRAAAAADANPDVRVVIVRGEGKHFSFGLDLMAMMDLLGPIIAGTNLAAERSRLLGVIGEMQRATEGLATCRKPVIAAISGWCIGGALNLAAAADIRICSADARFSLREVKLAITADLGGLQRLPRIIGDGNARELAFTGADIDANRALQMGLVNTIHPDPAALLTAAREMAAQIAANPPLVVQGCKQVMEYSADKSVADGLRFVAVWNSAFLQSEDLGEALGAFMERRPARFQGR